MLSARLTVKHLKMMHAIDAADSLTRAAELLNISQPALSSRLHDAQEILGTSLFEKRGRRLVITPAGQLLLRSSHTVLKELQRVEEELLQIPDQVGRTLRIGMPQYASFAWLPAAVKAFEKRHRNVALEIVSEAAFHPRNALAQDSVDIAIVASPNRSIQVDRQRFHCRRMIEDEFVALLPATHAKANSPFLIAEDFIHETYITNSAIPEKNREYELFFQPNAVYPQRVVQVGFTGAILELVASGIGTTIITRWIMDADEKHSNVVSRPLTSKGLPVYWFAIYSKKDAVSKQAKTLCEVIESQAR